MVPPLISMERMLEPVSRTAEGSSSWVFSTSVDTSRNSSTMYFSRFYEVRVMKFVVYYLPFEHFAEILAFSFVSTICFLNTEVSSR